MWVIDLIIACQKAKQRREEEAPWYLAIERLLKRQHERRTKERAENIKRKKRWYW